MNGIFQITRPIYSGPAYQAGLRSGDAIIAVGKDGKIILWNPAAQRVFGFTAADAVGQSLDLIIPERFREQGDQRQERGEDGQHRVVGQGRGQVGALVPPELGEGLLGGVLPGRLGQLARGVWLAAVVFVWCGLRLVDAGSLACHGVVSCQ